MGKVSTTDIEHGFSNLQGCWKQGLVCLWKVGGKAGKLRGKPREEEGCESRCQGAIQSISSNAS